MDIADTALRRRISSLKHEWQIHLDSEGKGPEYSETAESMFHNGLLRRALRRSLGESRDRMIGSHDPDGHLFTIRSVSAHKREAGGNNSSEGIK